MHRLSLVLVLPLLGCGCVQASPSLGLLFAGLQLGLGFPQSWSYLFWAVVVHRLPSVLVLALLGNVFSAVLVLALLGCGYT